MNSVIKIGFSLTWEKPVLIHEGGLCTRAISGPREALRYLKKDFDQRTGQLYWDAVFSCVTALRYRSAPSVARQYFLFACDNARIDAD
ncbi:DUF982 domain-containing protein [Rhizobium sp. BR 317]|uniref:DUF982 domain-containing protein n=1 Tax=Rhizobium sp. BR 317 TaxID=3040015 RepID=UPI0039BFA96C